MKTIVFPSAAYRAAFINMALDYRQSDDRRYFKEITKYGFDFDDYVIRLNRNALGIGLEEGLTPYTTYWLMDDNKDIIYGVSRLRHKLNAISQKEGGHIGYDVPPSLRNNGYATELLRQTIIKARSMGITRLLMTCDSDNIRSARVIEKNGGIIENQVISDITRKLVSRYWIDADKANERSIYGQGNV